MFCMGDLALARHWRMALQRSSGTVLSPPREEGNVTALDESPLMLSHLQGTTGADGKLMPPSLPAPRVRVTKTEAGQVIEPILDEAVSLEAFRVAFLRAFATTDEVVAQALFIQLLNGLHTEPNKPVDPATANLALALMHEIGPKGRG